MDSVTLTFEELFQFLGIDNNKYEEIQEVSEKLYVKTPSDELAPINWYVKKEAECQKTTLENGAILETAKKHIVQKDGVDVFIDSVDSLDTIYGKMKIVKKEDIGKHEVYDFNIPAPHLYVTPNGVIHHNTLFMTHLATSFQLKGYNVLYITLEMDEREIAKRIDANLLSIDINELKNTTEDDFVSQYKSIMANGLGNLIVKEYPTGGANGIHFKSLLKELDQKQKFRPDIICVDYLGIMGAVSENMYDNIKKNAESLRAISIEFDCAVITASQTNRSGFDRNNGIMMSDIAESTGPLQISDLVIGISKFETGTNESEEENTNGFNKVAEQQILINILKNRMGGLTSDKFLLLQKFNYMRLEEVQSTYSSNKPTTSQNDAAKFVLTSSPSVERTFNF